MKIVLKSGLTIAMLSMCLQSKAGDTVTIKGAGARGCGTWLKETDSVMRLTNLNWILGYLSGAATATRKNVLKEVDADSIEAAISKYCQENPLEGMDSATATVFKQLADRISK